MTVRIYIELARDRAGKPRVGGRGPLYLARRGSPGGEVLVNSSVQPLLDAAHVLLSRGITGRAEMWRASLPYACMAGEIAELAKWKIREDEKIGPTFVHWKPFPAARMRPRSDETVVPAPQLPEALETLSLSATAHEGAA
jgi:hypothetical protein